MFRSIPRRSSHVLACVTALAFGSIGLTLTSCQSSSQSNLPKVVLITKPSFVKQWDTQLHVTGSEKVVGLYLTDAGLHAITDKNFDHALSVDAGALMYFNQVAPIDQQLHGGPCLVSGGIIFGARRTLELYTRDGHLQRSIDLDYTLTNAPVSFGDTVYVGINEGGGRLASVDSTKEIDPVNWEVMTFGTVDGPVGIVNGAVFFGSEDGSVRACFFDRTPLWPLLDGSRFTTGGQIFGGVVADNSGCYFSTSEGTVYSVGLDNGKLQWRYFAGAPLDTTPQVMSDTVYQYVPGTGLVAIDKTSKLAVEGGNSRDVAENPVHSARWIVKNGVKVLSQDSQYVYVQSKSNTILAIDKQTGTQAFESVRHDLIAFAENTKTSTIYAATKKGVVLAIQPMLTTGSYGELASGSQRFTDQVASR